MSPVAEIKVRYEPLRDFCAQVFAGLALPGDDAWLVADSLVEADLRGVHSHGVLMVPRYVAQVRRGQVNVHPDIKVVRETPGSLLVDGDNGLGQVVARRAMALAIDKARQTGISAVGVAQSNHYAAGAYWALMAVAENMIGLALTGAGAVIAPWGGRTRLLGTNPWTIAVPAGREYAIVLDMATSVAAAGKLEWAAMRHERVPAGWALDAEDRTTTDPQRGLAGRLLPTGGYKGYGLMVMVDMLAGMLTGGAMGPEMSAAARDARPFNIGHYFQAIEIAAFMPVDAFKARVDEYIRIIRQSELEAGSSEVLLPGEREFRTAENRRRDGIPMPVTMLTQLEKIARDVGIALAW